MQIQKALWAPYVQRDESKPCPNHLAFLLPPWALKMSKSETKSKHCFLCRSPVGWLFTLERKYGSFEAWPAKNKGLNKYCWLGYDLMRQHNCVCSQGQNISDGNMSYFISECSGSERFSTCRLGFSKVTSNLGFLVWDTVCLIFRKCWISWFRKLEYLRITGLFLFFFFFNLKHQVAVSRNMKMLPQ